MVEKPNMTQSIPTNQYKTRKIKNVQAEDLFKK